MYKVVAVPAAGTLANDTYYLTERSTWVHTMRSGEAHRFTDEAEAKRVAAKMQVGLSTRIVEVIAA